MDLDWVLGVVADGPTKTFAFRRLKYLTSKWNMYSLLNENQELADMKVCLMDWFALLGAYLVGKERTTQVS